MSSIHHERRNAALYGLVVGVVLTACIWLAIACDCTARQTGAIALAGFLIASVGVGTVTR
jgi:hypothetical protein